ncbi:hypothetical protein [Sphingorhabdus sp.]|uniref:hypothetical protein n=1 Tax=Sphingorhabdus sp. TaxID=1902408 RepID=UPI002FD96062
MMKVFFSWQSDVAQNATTRVLRMAIAAAAADLTAKTGATVEMDEATRNVPGSPYIPGKLAEKIRKSDIFVADITAISVTEDGKSIPNPNVSFELGLAAAYLGWDRIVMIFNESVAKFENLPFDFDRHRITKYKIAETKNVNEGEQKRLLKLVTVAIETIINQNPLRPRDIEGKSDAEVKHERDVVNLRWYLNQISIDLIGIHIRDMPQMLHYFAAMMVDGLEGVVSSPSFYLYDKKLEDLLRALYIDLRETLAYESIYRDLPNRWVHGLGLRGSQYDAKKEASAAKAIRKSIASLQVSLNRVIKKVRENYLEIDLDETSHVFGKHYRAMVKEVEGELKD